MRWRGRVFEYIKSMINSGQKLHFSLIDPERVASLDQLRSILKAVVEAGTDAILIGGSLMVYSRDVDSIAQLVEEFDRPSILFPGSVVGLSPYADAILFISLLNSEDPYFIVGAQVYAAPLIKRFGLEVLPTAYIIVGYGGTAGFMGRARPIPFEKPEIGVAYALAAKFMGMKFVYLEAGSGAPRPVPPEFVKRVKEEVKDVFLIVGGGIRDPEIARQLVESGADIIVTGTIIEKDVKRASEIISSIKRR